ncbi:MAG: hypothetical protein IKG93_02815 [Clostridiales bacterium]|nr:hypothetical protein [Clostridiales bacterium]
MDQKKSLKIKCLIAGLAIEAVVLCVLAWCTGVFQNIDAGILSFPFVQIADAVRFLSEKGGILRGLGMALLTLVSILPLVLAFTEVGGRKKELSEKILLVALSVVLGFGLYLMINPSVFLPVMLLDLKKFFGCIVSITIWSVILICFAMSGVNLLRAGNKKSLMRGFSIVLVALSIIFVAEGSLSLGSKLKALAPVRLEAIAGEKDVGEEGMVESGVGEGIEVAEKTTADSAFEVAECIQIAAPCVLNVILCILVLRLIMIYTSEEQEGLKKAAGDLGRMSCRMLVITLVLSAACNLFQILLIKEMTNIHVNMELPILSVAFVVIAVLFSRLIMENKDLKDDNEMFI